MAFWKYFNSNSSCLPKGGLDMDLHLSFREVVLRNPRKLKSPLQKVARELRCGTVLSSR